MSLVFKNSSQHAFSSTDASVVASFLQQHQEEMIKRETALEERNKDNNVGDKS